jgi:hypothetical protein
MDIGWNVQSDQTVISKEIEISSHVRPTRAGHKVAIRRSTHRAKDHGTAESQVAGIFTLEERVEPTPHRSIRPESLMFEPEPAVAFARNLRVSVAETGSLKPAAMIATAGIYPWRNATGSDICSRAKLASMGATNAVQPVWWLAPRPRPVSPWKYS